MIARINVGEPVIREALHSLLLRIGMAHPQVGRGREERERGEEGKARVFF